MTRRHGGKKSGSWQAIELAAVACGVFSFSGCGPKFVDPGPPLTRAAPTPSTLPNSHGTPAQPGLPTLESPDLQQTPMESVLPLTRETSSAKYHTVQAGETLSSIARKYHVNADSLRSANGLDAATTLKPQQLLFIPESR